MFNSEQIKRLQYISKLPREKQQEELGKFLSGLTSEQIEFLKQQQRCLFCNIASKQADSVISYEDDNNIAVMDINPVSLGHVIFMPKRHDGKIDEKLVEGISLAITSGMNAEDVEVKAGQQGMHAMVHLIPRYSVERDASKITKEMLAEHADRIKKSFLPKSSQKIENEKEQKTEEIITVIDYASDNYAAEIWLEERIP